MGREAGRGAGKLGFDQAMRAIENVSYTLDLADIADCDLIIEAVPEKLELKQRVFAELDGIVKADCIFASNTSGFVIAEIARDVSEARKANFIGMHFSNPVPVMRMLEVITTEESDPEVAEIAKGRGGEGWPGGVDGEGQAGDVWVHLESGVRGGGAGGAADCR